MILLCVIKPQELLTNILPLLKNRPISKYKQWLCHRSIQALNNYDLKWDRLDIIILNVLGNNICKFIDLVKYLFTYCYWCFWWFGAIESLEIMVILYRLCICLKVMKDNLLVFYTMQTNIWKKACISWIFQSRNIVLICGHLSLFHLWLCGREKPGTIIYYTAIV